MRVAYLVTPGPVGALAGTDLSVGDAIAIFSLSAAFGLVLVSESSERLRLTLSSERR
jgi:hypothetical protein